MLNQLANPVLRVAFILKFFAWCCALLAFIVFAMVFKNVLNLPAEIRTESFISVCLRTLTCLAAMTVFFWMAYVLLLLHRIVLHSRRQTRVIFNILHPPTPSAKIPNLAPSPLPDLAPAPTPDTSLPRAYRITGLDKNGLRFVLTYQWITREDAIARAVSDGLVEILDVQLLKNESRS